MLSLAQAKCISSLPNGTELWVVTVWQSNGITTGDLPLRQ